MSTPPTPQHSAETNGSVYLGRRLLLALGGAALVSGCTTDQVSTAGRDSTAGAGQPGSDMSTVPGDSHPGEPADPASPPATPSPGSLGPPATVAKPVPDVCPPVPGVKEKLGGPQHYLPCHGTNIALTIDDGPDPTYTPLILALLSRYNISATFCMIGARAAANPALVARVAGAGHHLANHTYTHPLNLPGLTPAQIHDQTLSVMARIHPPWREHRDRRYAAHSPRAYRVGVKGVERSSRCSAALAAATTGLRGAAVVA